MIKVIPTIYNGIKFRSRTEARWAVFFDALDVRWEYEHEGYQLPSGWYLPDFWLPEVNDGVFLEIKPEREPTETERSLCFELVEKTGQSVAMAHGSPIEFIGAEATRGPWDGVRGHITIVTRFHPSQVSDCDHHAFSIFRNKVALDLSFNVDDGYIGDPCHPRIIAAIEKSRTFSFWNPRVRA